MRFLDWLKLREAGTSTSSIAVFARPIGDGVLGRKLYHLWGQEEEPKKKRKRKKRRK